MKLRELEQMLSLAKPFAKPKVELEQYATDDHIAARMIYTAASSWDDIEDRRIVDLGAGCGILALACIFMGAAHVTAVDIDQAALDQCLDNMRELEVEESDGLELILADVLSLPSLLRADEKPVDKEKPLLLQTEQLSFPFDTAVLNPPFGTKANAGIDVQFLQTAYMLAPVVYSMHKSSTREYLVRKAESWGATVTVIAQMKFSLPRQFKFHKQDHLYVDVDLIRLERKAMKALPTHT